MKRYVAVMFGCMLCVVARAETLRLKTKTIEITPPAESVPLDADSIKKRFYKGNPPHVVFDLVGTGSTLTIRESVTLEREVPLSEMVKVMLPSLQKSTKAFSLVSSGDKAEEGMAFYEIVFTDVSDNDLAMTRHMRLYIEDRTLVIVTFGIPTAFLDQYEPRMLQSVRSIRFVENEDPG